VWATSEFQLGEGRLEVFDGRQQEQEEIAGKLLSQFFGGGDDGGV